MAVNFLNTRVMDPDEDDWGKLKRAMKYIKGKLGVNLTLRVYSLSAIKLWVDASFDTHNDFWGHTGGMMSLGAGDTTSGSWKQNINGKISIENKIIVINDRMGPVL